MKWLETDVEARLADKQDTCRVGYVAFSRAREFLCIACLEKVDSELREHMIKLDIEIVPLAKKLLKV
jgi:DNA helicase II / ATP-dependent DNA helicase PcrA